MHGWWSLRFLAFENLIRQLSQVRSGEPGAPLLLLPPLLPLPPDGADGEGEEVNDNGGGGAAGLTFVEDKVNCGGDPPGDARGEDIGEGTGDCSGVLEIDESESESGAAEESEESLLVLKMFLLTAVRPWYSL